MTKDLARFIAVSLFMAIICVASFGHVPVAVSVIAALIGAGLALSSPSMAFVFFSGAFCVPYAALGMPGLLPAIGCVVAVAFFVMHLREQSRLTSFDLAAGALLLITLTLVLLRDIPNGDLTGSITLPIGVILAAMLARANTRVSIDKISGIFLAFVVVGFVIRAIAGFVTPPVGLADHAQAMMNSEAVRAALGDKGQVWVGGIKYARLLLPGEEPNYAAVQLSIQSAIALLMLSHSFSGAARRSISPMSLAWLVGFGLTLVEILGTYSRTGIVCVGILCCLFLFTVRVGLAGRAMLGALMLLPAAFLPALLPGLLGRLGSLQQQLQNHMDARTIAWEGALDTFKNHVILGGGAGSVQAEHGIAAHNTYASVFAEQGAIGGVVLVIVCFVLPIYGIIQSSRVNVVNRSLQAIAFGFWILFQVAMFTLNIGSAWVFVWGLAIVQWAATPNWLRAPTLIAKRSTRSAPQRSIA